MANHPDFIQNAEYRQKCLGELAYLRELRHESKQRLLALASHTSRSNGGAAASVNTGPLFSPPLGKINTLICLLFQKIKCSDCLMLFHIYIYIYKIPAFSTVHSTLCTAYSKLCALLFIACCTHIINHYC